MDNTKNKAIFLDRDGTLNFDSGYISKIEELTIIEGVTEALKLLYDSGYMLFVVTNQSGIARGYFSKEDCDKFNSALKERVASQGVEIKDFHVCPHSPEDNCLCRKPKTQMLEDAIKEHNIDREKSYMFGDKLTDIECGERADIKSFLITEDKTLLYFAKKITNR
ncbi:MAG: HAD family hydrolase [Rikenellaceae bacterium]